MYIWWVYVYKIYSVMHGDYRALKEVRVGRIIYQSWRDRGCDGLRWLYSLKLRFGGNVLVLLDIITHE
jgi:hypothetical protein